MVDPIPETRNEQVVEALWDAIAHGLEVRAVPISDIGSGLVVKSREPGHFILRESVMPDSEGNPELMDVLTFVSDSSGCMVPIMRTDQIIHFVARIIAA